MNNIPSHRGRLHHNALKSLWTGLILLDWILQDPPRAPRSANKSCITHIRLVVLTEYCKSMSSQSGRQAQSDSAVLLICLKNSCALLALRKDFSVILVTISSRCSMKKNLSTCTHLWRHPDSGAGTFMYEIQFNCILRINQPMHTMAGNRMLLELP